MPELHLHPFRLWLIADTDTARGLTLVPREKLEERWSWMLRELCLSVFVLIAYTLHTVQSNLAVHLTGRIHHHPKSLTHSLSESLTLHESCTGGVYLCME